MHTVTEPAIRHFSLFPLSFARPQTMSQLFPQRGKKENRLGGNGSLVVLTPFIACLTRTDLIIPFA